jgi:BirA family biotin operon repressor/biotin-[acetyl-CoA-carboxylase] ligase
VSIWPQDLVEIPAIVAQRGLVLGRKLEFSASTQSTNDDAKQGAKHGAAHGTVWLADHQGAGRGRQGRTWSSPAGENVLMSVLVRGTFAPRRVPLAALVAGLAARSAVARALGARVLLKWPNDVQVESGRKVAGILVEAQSRGAALESIVIGIGINVHTRQFPEDVAERATSIALQGGAPDRAQLVADVLTYLDAHVPSALAGGLGPLSAELARYDALLGQRVQSESGAGLAEGIDEEGRLLVRDAAGNIHAWSFGEVHLERAPP